MAKKLLMYSQDVGGGRFILPVVKELIAKRIAPDTVVAQMILFRVQQVFLYSMQLLCDFRLLVNYLRK